MSSVDDMIGTPPASRDLTVSLVAGFAEDAPEPVAVTDGTGRLLWANAAWSALGGALPLDDSTDTRRELQVTAPTGEPRVFRVRTKFLRSGGAAPVAVLHIARDVTRGTLRAADELAARAAAEAALAESEARLRAFLDNSPNFVWAKDTGGRYILANRYYCEKFGTAEDALLGKTDRERFNLDADPDWVANDRTVIHTGAPIEVEEAAVLADGKLHTTLSGKFPLRDAKGEIVGVGGIATDITHLREAEERLQAALAEQSLERERLSVALNALVQGIALVEPEGRVSRVNDAFAQMHGFADAATCLASFEEWAGWVSMRDTEGHEVPIDQWPASRALRGETVHATEYTLHRKPAGDAVFAGMWGAAPIRDAKGRVVQAVVSIHDITPRRRMEDALKAGEENLRLAQEAAGIGSWTVDFRDGRATWSDSEYRLLGHEPGAIPAAYDSFIAHVLEEDRERMQRELDDAIARHEDWTSAFRIRRADGEIRWLSARGRAFYAPDGTALGVRGINYDITERKDAEERQALLMREVDHRAKNALAVVQALVRLTRDAEPAAFRQAVVGRIRAMTSAHSLLAAEKWDGAPIHALVQAEFEALPAERIHLSGPPLRLAPHAAQSVSLIIHELATNAAKYGALSGAAGTITLSWSEPAHGGLAIAWREAGGPAVTPPRQLGFGSTLVRQTVERQLFGSVAFAWEPSGVEVTITLPVDALAAGRAGAAAAKPAAQRARKAARRVLIVEDEPIVALDLEDMLRRLGYHTIGPATSLAEAFRLADEPLDAAVLDVNLGPQTVWPLAERLRDAGVHVVFCSGYQRGQTTSVRFPDAPWLCKPVSAPDLELALSERALR